MAYFRNGIEIPSVDIDTKTASYTITVGDFGKSIRMNSGAATIFTLPSVGATDNGMRITLIKLGAGRVTIQCVDTDTILDSAATGTLYNDIAGETYANVILEYVHTTTNWTVIGSSGTWVST